VKFSVKYPTAPSCGLRTSCFRTRQDLSGLVDRDRYLSSRVRWVPSHPLRLGTVQVQTPFKGSSFSCRHILLFFPEARIISFHRFLFKDPALHLSFFLSCLVSRCFSTRHAVLSGPSSNGRSSTPSVTARAVLDLPSPSPSPFRWTRQARSSSLSLPSFPK
jgi:hypothetical protein